MTDSPARCATSSTGSTGRRRPTAAPATSSTLPRARSSRTRPGLGAGGRRRGLRGGRRAFESWRDSTPAERQQALLRSRTRSRRGPTSSSGSRARTPASRTPSPPEEIPPMVDQIRFFAGAARMLEGRAAGSTWRGTRPSIRREPIGVVGQVTPWNYPMMMADLEVRARPSPRATPSSSSRATPRRRPRCCSPRSPGRVPAARRAQRGPRRPRHRPRSWSSTRCRRWSRSPDRSGPAWRSPRPRPRT